MRGLFFGLFVMAAVVAQASKVKLELLVFNGCPNSPQMLHNVEAALRKLHLKIKVETVDLEKLPKGDARTGYGAPTLLRNGKDLFGNGRPNTSGSLSCRIYPGSGVPSVSQIVAALKRGA